MKKLVTLFALFCVLNVLMIGGLIGFLAGTGRLDRTKFQTIADLLHHQGTPDNLRNNVYDILEPSTAPSTAPSSRPAMSLGGDSTPASAEERIDYRGQAMEQERMRVENQAQNLRNQQKLLEQMQARVEETLRKIDDQKKSFEQTVTQTTSKSVEESFQKSLALYDELKPKQVKDLFLPMTPALVAKYLQAMDTDRAGKIISEFQTPEERTFIASVIDRIRSAGTDSASGTRADGTTAAAGT